MTTCPSCNRTRAFRPGIWETSQRSQVYRTNSRGSVSRLRSAIRRALRTYRRERARFPALVASRASSCNRSIRSAAILTRSQSAESQEYVALFGGVETPNFSAGKYSRVRETYRTVAGRGQASFEIQGSEFIGHVTTAESVAAAEEFIEDIASAYDDATHNVPAYRVRAQPLREWSSDAGEPSGSAGKPALNVLQQEDLENVVAVVTRYYGGTKLGVGGLARAYSRGVKDAIEDAGTTERRPHEHFSITVEYDDSGTVRGILESSEVEFDAHYEETVEFEVTVPTVTGSELRDRLRSATSGRADIEL